MTALIVVETLLLVLLSVLVAGLLRSHAEILRRLSSMEERGAGGASSTVAKAVPAGADLPEPRVGATPASDVVGQTIAGDPIHIGVNAGGTSTLLAFLTSGCLSCRTLWDGLDPRVRLRMPGGARMVVVTKGPEQESPRKLRDLAPRDVQVVMSSEAWDEYGVPASPYFIYVDGPSGQVHGEGAASQWSQVVSLLSDALADAEEAGVTAEGNSTERALRPRPEPASRLSRVEADLLAAGIGPGHPSLYGPGPTLDEREEAPRP